MGDKIDFPLNNDVYLTRAIKHIERGEYGPALDYIEKIYETDKSHYINRLYTLALFSLERYALAYEIAMEHKELYLEDENQIFMFIMLLIKNQQFIEAEAIIQQKRLDSFSNFQQEWENVERELNLERELVNFEIDMKKRNTKKKLANLSQFSMNEQSQIIQDARLLSLETLQEFAQQIFADPFVAGHIQRAFLELLVELGDKNNYTFSWFNQSKELSPIECTVFSQSIVLKKVNENLEKKLDKYPSMIEGIRMEMINDLLMLYPFEKEVVTDSDYWIQAYMSVYIDSLELPEPINEQQEDMNDWIEKLNMISKRI